MPPASHKLQGHLLSTREFYKLHKYLRKLSTLPITAEVLSTLVSERKSRGCTKASRSALWPRPWQPSGNTWLYLSPSLDKAVRVLRRAGTQRTKVGMCFCQRGGTPEASYAKTQSGSQHCSSQIGHTVRPQLPTPPSQFAACCHSTGNSEKCLTLVTPAPQPENVLLTVAMLILSLLV